MPIFSGVGSTTPANYSSNEEKTEASTSSSHRETPPQRKVSSELGGLTELQRKKTLEEMNQTVDQRRANLVKNTRRFESNKFRKKGVPAPVANILAAGTMLKKYGRNQGAKIEHNILEKTEKFVPDKMESLKSFQAEKAKNKEPMLIMETKGHLQLIEDMYAEPDLPSPNKGIGGARNSLDLHRVRSKKSRGVQDTNLGSMATGSEKTAQPASATYIEPKSIFEEDSDSSASSTVKSLPTSENKAVSTGTALAPEIPAISLSKEQEALMNSQWEKLKETRSRDKT